MHASFEIHIEELYLFEENGLRAVFLNVKLTAETDAYLNVDLDEYSIEVDCDNGKLGKEAKGEWIKLDLEEPEGKALASLIIKAIERDHKALLHDEALEALDSYKEGLREAHDAANCMPSY
jgi:hypothetical protein